jgi:elongation factor Ts
MQITASMVKELRERTGAGMMECKKALTESEGNMESAIELMRKSGLAKADKKSSRIAAEGVIFAVISTDKRQAAMVEINCETDFVSKGEEFRGFARSIADRILGDGPADVQALSELRLNDAAAQSVETARQELVAKIGENIKIRRFLRMVSETGQIGLYLHGNRIGVLVDIKGADEAMAKDIAMHVAASRPICVAEDEVPEELLVKEKEIFSAQAEASGKPPNIIERMVQGRLKKYLAEVTLLGQDFVKDPNKTVGKLLKGSGAEVNGFERYEVGEGLEKRSENFAEEVMAQVKGD